MEVDNVNKLLPSDVSSLTIEQENPEEIRAAVPNSLELPMAATPSDSKNSVSDVSPQEGHSDKKKRIRRRHRGGKHHRKWKPYTMMTWAEKKILEDKEGQKAAQKREKRFASGQAMAPYNTTQFLMDLHDPDSQFELSKQHTRSRRDSVPAGTREGSGSLGTSDEYYSSPDDEKEMFSRQEFSVAYDDFHTEHIRSLSKDDLVKEYLEMERKCETLERNQRRESSSKVGRLESTSTSGCDSSVHEELLKVRAEREVLLKENELLQNENEQLRCEQVALLSEKDQLLSQAAETEDKENNPDLEV